MLVDTRLASGCLHLCISRNIHKRTCTCDYMWFRIWKHLSVYNSKCPHAQVPQRTMFKHGKIWTVCGTWTCKFARLTVHACHMRWLCVCARRMQIVDGQVNLASLLHSCGILQRGHPIGSSSGTVLEINHAVFAAHQWRHVIWSRISINIKDKSISIDCH